jgi:hypothetical protein
MAGRFGVGCIESGLQESTAGIDGTYSIESLFGIQLPACFGCCSQRSAVKLLCLRVAFAMLRGAVFALILAGAAVHQPAAQAGPDAKKQERRPQQIAAELVGQTGERQAPGPLGIAVAGDYAYLAAWRRGLRVVNISNPKEPKEVGGCRIQGDAKDVVVAGGYAFVAAEEGGLRVLDLARPASPKEVGSCRTRGEALAVIVTGKLAYVTDQYEKDNALHSSLRVVDVSDPRAPTVVGSLERPGQLMGLAVAENYLFAASRQGFLYVVDVSNPKAPLEVASLRGTGEGQGVVLSGKYAYIPDRDGFLHIVDVSNPKAPKLVGSSPDEPGIALAAAIDGHHVYVGSKRGALHVLDVSDPRDPVWVGSYKTSGRANGVTLAGTRVYVNEGEGGLTILQFRLRGDGPK